MTDREWLDSLQPGDSVLVCSGMLTIRYDRATVEAVGKTWIRVSGYSSKFRKRNGYAYSGEEANIVQPTPELLASIELDNDRRMVARWYREALHGSMSHEALKAGMQAAMSYHSHETSEKG